MDWFLGLKSKLRKLIKIPNEPNQGLNASQARLESNFKLKSMKGSRIVYKNRNIIPKKRFLRKKSKKKIQEFPKANIFVYESNKDLIRVVLKRRGKLTMVIFIFLIL